MTRAFARISSSDTHVRIYDLSSVWPVQDPDFPLGIRTNTQIDEQRCI